MRRRIAGLALLLLLLAASRGASAYVLVYDVTFLPSSALARLEIRVRQQDGQLHEVRFNVEGERWFDFGGDGEIVAGDPVVWKVPVTGGTLRYSVQLEHLRDPAEYDARISERWAIFRGEDLVPPISTRFTSGAESDAELRFRLPPKWRVLTPHPRVSASRFTVEQEGRSMDRPRGWIIAGELDYLRATLGGMEVTVSSPDDHDVHRRDLLALLTWTVPVLETLVEDLPERLLVVGADDPMWRGGLSGPDSLFVHADRPLIDDDGTSPLLHELMHVVSHARSGPQGDWIVEGLAEYYSIELLVRSGTLLPEHADAVLERLRKRGAGAKPERFRSSDAKGAVTARAVSIMHDLDREIASRTEGRASLDDVLRRLETEGTAITLEVFLRMIEEATGLELGSFVRGRLP